jgi:hypothetical protein
MITDIGPIDNFDHDYSGVFWDRNRPVVPVDSNGNMVSYPYRFSSTSYWGVVLPFRSRMQYVDYTHGRSAMNFTLRSIEYGFTYPVPLGDFMWLVENDVLTKGLTYDHEWYAKKQGSNYMLKIREAK